MASVDMSSTQRTASANTEIINLITEVINSDRTPSRPSTGPVSTITDRPITKGLGGDHQLGPNTIKAINWISLDKHGQADHQGPGRVRDPTKGGGGFSGWPGSVWRAAGGTLNTSSAQPGTNQPAEEDEEPTES